jgi:predicted  nucleic acid-binding Zn-ribbon protein
MFKLIKWSLITVIAVGVAGFAVLGDHFGSYVGTVSSSVRDSVRGNIPIGFQIERAENLIRAIDPEVNDCKRELARAEVELEHLIENVSRLQKKVQKQARKLKSGQKLLSDVETSSYETDSGYVYSRRRVELELGRTLEMYKNNRAMLKSKQALIERQTMSVTASRVKLDSVRTKKAELENTIAALKVQKKHLDALAASSSRFNLDDSALSKATELLAEVKKRLDVTQRMIEDDMFFAEGITDDRAPRRDILKEINRQFSEESAQPKKLTARNATPLEIDR